MLDYDVYRHQILTSKVDPNLDIYDDFKLKKYFGLHDLYKKYFRALRVKVLKFSPFCLSLKKKTICAINEHYICKITIYSDSNSFFVQI